MKTNKILMSVAVSLLASCVSVWGQSSVSAAVAETGEACGMPVAGASMQRSEGLMKVDLDLGLGAFDLAGDRAAVFTPVIKNGADSLELPSVGLYSRTRWFQYLRAGEQPLGGEKETTIRWSERPGAMSYSEIIPYAEWMNGAELYLRRRDYGCCHTLLDESAAALTGYREVYYMPVFRYVTPVSEAEKSRSLSGRAYIDFPVNRTEIYPEYRNNPVELRKIIATIDSVRNDSDITVKSITIKGYASPEGSYANNVRLAKGRTATLKEYVQNMYRFAPDFIATDYEPEDWEGLREYVAGSDIANREEILAIIDGSLEPDPKNAKIQKDFPVQYAFLLKEVYPGLRHSDYRIEYTIRSFTDVEELRATMAAAPQKLSLNEMFLLAQSYEPGSESYNDVFETAVRMFPENETANLNAANAAMQRGDFRSAERYLAKAGDSAETTYAKGVLAALQQNYDKAVELIRASALPDTESTLENIMEVRNR